MNEIDFSIIFPSRDHQELLINLISSISRNTADISRIEVLIAIDACDANMNDFINTHKYSFVKFFKVQRSLNFSRDYYNYLCNQSRGRWVIGCNDDTEFMTKDWDKHAKESLEKYLQGGQNIVYGWIEDMLGTHRMTQYGNYSCFPLLGREGINALGYFFPTDIPTWGADIWTEQLYRNVGRIVQLPIVIKHISIHNNLRAPDALHHRIASNQVPTSILPRPDQINAMIQALRAPKKESVNA